MITKLIWDRSSQDKTAGYSEQGNWQILRATGIADNPERQLTDRENQITAIQIVQRQRWLPTDSVEKPTAGIEGSVSLATVWKACPSYASAGAAGIGISFASLRRF